MILVASSHEQLAKEITDVLAMEGYKAFDCVCGNANLAGANADSLELIVIAASEVDVDCMTFLQQSRANPALSNVPILILSHYWGASEERQRLPQSTFGIGSGNELINKVKNLLPLK